MASCYHCGAYIAPNQGYRRKVATGDSIGLSFGRRITPSVRAYYGRRTLCLYCAAQYDDAAKKRSTGFLLIILVGLVLAGLVSLWGVIQNTFESFDSGAKTQGGSGTRAVPSIETPTTPDPISAKIESLNCYPIDFCINSELVASIPPGMARVATTQPGPFETKLCLAHTSTCGDSAVVNWRDGMTYTIGRHESCDQ